MLLFPSLFYIIHCWILFSTKPFSLFFKVILNLFCIFNFFFRNWIIFKFINYCSKQSISIFFFKYFCFRILNKSRICLYHFTLVWILVIYICWNMTIQNENLVIFLRNTHQKSLHTNISRDLLFRHQYTYISYRIIHCVQFLCFWNSSWQ